MLDVARAKIWTFICDAFNESEQLLISVAIKIHRTSIGNPIRGDEVIYYGVLRKGGFAWNEINKISRAQRVGDYISLAYRPLPIAERVAQRSLNRRNAPINSPDYSFEADLYAY